MMNVTIVVEVVLLTEHVIVKVIHTIVMEIVVVMIIMMNVMFVMDLALKHHIVIAKVMLMIV